MPELEKKNAGHLQSSPWSQYDCGRVDLECGSPECLFVQAVAFLDLVKGVLLERAFDVVQDVVHTMLVWSGQTLYQGSEA